MLDNFRHGYARFRLRYPIYFFHHIPKCGGSSVRGALEHWFHVNDDYYDEHLASAPPPMDLSICNSLNCISGHFGHQGHFIDQRYPDIFDGFRAKKRYRAFMFLRDPLQMRCSLYRHDLKMGKSKSGDLATAIMPYNDYYARIIQVDEHNWQRKIDQYFFVGVADNRLQLSFDLLAKLIGKPRVELPKINTTKEITENSASSLSQTQIENFKAANSLDYQIFNYAKAKLEELSTKY